MNNYATIHLSDIGRANPVTYVQQNITVPPQWSWGQATRSLICFNSKTKPWSIRVRSDHSIDVDGYGRSKRYRFKDCADAVRIVNACFKAYE